MTDRTTTAYIYDLDLPGSPPAAVMVPTELDYDPIHNRVYMARIAEWAIMALLSRPCSMRGATLPENVEGTEAVRVVVRQRGLK